VAGFTHRHAKDPREVSGGVRLQRIEQLSAAQKVVRESYRLSTLRNNGPRTFADVATAEDAFDLEVVAALTDPIIVDMQRRGLID